MTSAMPTPIHIGEDDVLLDAAVVLSKLLPARIGVVGDDREPREVSNGGTVAGGSEIAPLILGGGRDDCATPSGGTAGVVPVGGCGGLALGGICGGGDNNGRGDAGGEVGGGMLCGVLDEERGT